MAEGAPVALVGEDAADHPAGGQIDVDGARMHFHKLGGVGLEVLDGTVALPDQRGHQIGARKGVGDHITHFRSVALHNVARLFLFLRQPVMFEPQKEEIRSQKAYQQGSKGIHEAPGSPFHSQKALFSRRLFLVTYQPLHGAVLFRGGLGPSI